MKIALVQNVILENNLELNKSILQPHLGLISLVSIARKFKHDAVIYDPMINIASGALIIDTHFYENIANEILESSPKIVGFTGLGSNFICVIKVAEIIKQKNPELIILLGGPHATVLAQEVLLEFNQFDIIVRGECESIFGELIDSIESNTWHLIDGISYKKDKNVIHNPSSLIPNIESLPFPAFDAYPIKELGLTFLRVEAGRGCPFSCTFCSTAEFFGRQYRVKSPSKLCSELDFLYKTYGITDFALQHDLFTVNKNKVRLFCEEVQDRGYSWTCSARIDCVDSELLLIMRNAGCRAIYFGIETGSINMQNILHKKLDLNLVAPIMDTVKKLELTATVSFITGFPEETKQDLKLTLDLLGLTIIRYPFNVQQQLHLLTPEPGTPLYTRFSNSLNFDGHITDFNFSPVNSNDNEIMKLNPNVFMTHHYYSGKLSRDYFTSTTTIFNEINKLGQLVISEILSFFDDSLAYLIDCIIKWKYSRKNYQIITTKEFILWLGHHFGDEHYVISLCRYISVSYSIRNKNVYPLLKNIESTNLEDTELVLSPNCEIIRNIHDCPEILDFIERKLVSEITINIDKDIKKNINDYVVLLPGYDSNYFENYILNDTSRELLYLFRKPRKVKNTVSKMLQIGVPSNKTTYLITQLVESGVLTSSC